MRLYRWILRKLGYQPFEDALYYRKGDDVAHLLTTVDGVRPKDGL